MSQLAAPLRVLVVDDDPAILRTLLLSLRALGCAVQGAADAAEALQILQAQGEPQEVLLTDMRMGELSGVDLVRESLALEPDILCVVMTAFASYENAVAAISAGAFDYLPKPFSTEQLEHVLHKLSAVVALRRENQALRQSLRAGQGEGDWFYGITSPSCLALQALVERVAPSEATVLLTGETGSGKTALARALHRLSGRAAGPFVEVMCTTLAEQLFESEVFGHVRGAFTGAVREHKGKFERAQGGTLFLDEIGELSAASQAKLLRFLEDRIIERVGDSHPLTLDVRIVAATNRDLAAMVGQKLFREDLYYRFNMFECRVPPLRERREDIEPLALRLLRTAAAQYSPNPQALPQSLPPLVLQRLRDYAWPGNVRELRNVMERMALLSVGREAALHDLPAGLTGGCAPLCPTRHRDEGPAEEEGRVLTLRDVEERQIRRVLAQGVSMEKAAELLGTHTVTLWRKRKEYGLL